ncbi:MAG: hypothetical protein HOP29_10170 [Phycisphaerales bacterium]|nr:hypothetical protein [Phycisphaerales bacterium]
MSYFGVIHDFQPSCLRAGGLQHSILTLPLGGDYVLNHITVALHRAGCTDLTIVPAFEPDRDYADRLHEIDGRASCRVLTPSDRAEPECHGEASDTILLIDPRYWPVTGYDLSAVRDEHAAHAGAVFATCRGDRGTPALEQVVTDASGNVRRVQRIFDRMAWSNAESSIVPFCVLPQGLSRHGLTFPLAVTRGQLAARGVPVRDVPLESPVVCLSDEDGVLCLATGYARGVRVDDGACVPTSVRMIGDVMVNRDAHVGEGATIIGPTVIGRGATVGSGCIIAHSVIADRTVVVSGMHIHQRVYAGMGDRRPADNETPRLTPAAPDDTFQLIAGGRSIDPLLTRRRRRLLAVKRAGDVAVSLVGLAVLFPLMALTALLVKLTSPGPVLFVHRREGRDGREFGCAKFRTMRSDAHHMQRELAGQNEVDGPQFAIRNDPRVTRLGSMLRKTNIDELPQLWSVLIGDMSLVGPRPSPFRENQVCAPWRRARLSVRPGITGLWQICRHDRDGGDFHQWIYYDTAYVRNMSFRLDVKIIFYTFVSLGGTRPVAIENVIGRHALRRKAWTPTTPKPPSDGLPEPVTVRDRSPRIVG